MVEMLLRVDERTETIEAGVKFTLHGVKPDGTRAYGSYFVVDASEQPDSSLFKVGDTLTVTFDKAPVPVSDVERTIEDAERAGLSPALLV